MRANDTNNANGGEKQKDSAQQQPQPPPPLFLSGGDDDGNTALSLQDLHISGTATRTVTASSYQPSRQQFTRSHPIAIKRNKNRNNNDYDYGHTRGISAGAETSDDDDDEDNIDADDYSLGPNVERDAVRLGLVDASRRQQQQRHNLTSHSLPSRLLRAPLLGSVPTNEDYLLYRDIPTATLPPPMTLNDQPPSLSGVVMAEQTRTSYGSLRESNQKGRFLDGPSSYRDSRTGDIRRMEQRVRFAQKQAATENNHEDQQSQGEAHLSIRDRMKQARERNSKKGANKKPTSSLAAMFDDAQQQGNNSNETNSSAASMPGAFPATFHDFSSPFYENHISALPSGALSTSLTGLELLQRGLRLATITDHDSNYSSEQQQSDQLPRDANGHNALLSRSLSDPRGTGRRLAETQQRSPVLPSYPQPVPPNQFLPPLALGGTFLSPTGGVVVSHLSAAMQQQEPRQQQQQRQQSSFDAPDARANPDLEGAFEMDLE